MTVEPGAERMVDFADEGHESMMPPVGPTEDAGGMDEEARVRLLDEVAEAFSEDGALRHADERFRERPGQTDFALAVADTIARRGKLVVEAGTGIGKTYAYLVPVLLSGTRALISTATKSLQDQLYWRDLPHVRDALGVPVRTALLKGRGSYLCIERLTHAREEMGGSEPYLVATLGKIAVWAQGTRTGDLAELPGLDERSPVIPLVTSTRENCLGSDCPHFRECHVVHARREAMAADVVVVNHHLFFADLSIRESGMAELLPGVDTLVFDEAHQFNEAGLQFMGKALTTTQVLDFARDMLATGLRLARGLADWQKLSGECERSARDLRLTAVKQPMGARLRWDGDVPERIAPETWTGALREVCEACTAAAQALGTMSELAPDFPHLQTRAQGLADRAQAFSKPRPEDAVRWVEAGAALRLIESPLDIAEAMRERCFKRHQSWIFTSATLGDDEKLAWFTGQIGLDGAKALRMQSPFDYARQAALFVPADFPRPNDAAHPDAVAGLAARLAGILGGRTFVLTTTLRALKVIGPALAALFSAQQRPIEVLVQGSRPKRELIARFREHPESVLVGSQSFWEGIDVAGDALQLVIIDKLPFPPPNDPLVEARSQRLERVGRSSFAELSLPEAAVSLKQGAGRLIRRETDRGLLVVCDPRLATMSYGRRLVRALPPMSRLQTVEQAQDYLASLGEPLES